MPNNPFENKSSVVPIEKGHDIRIEHALEKGDWYEADKEELEKILVRLRGATSWDQELINDANEKIKELKRWIRMYDGYDMEKKEKYESLRDQLIEVFEQYSKKFL